VWLSPGGEVAKSSHEPDCANSGREANIPHLSQLVKEGGNQAEGAGKKEGSLLEKERGIKRQGKAFCKRMRKPNVLGKEGMTLST